MVILDKLSNKYGDKLNQDNKFIRSLIQSSLQGNNSALEQLFQMNLAKVYTLSFRLTSNYESAEKLTEAVFVEAWKQLGNLREDATFSSWITGITVYQCLKFLRENDDPKLYEAPLLPSKSQLEKIVLGLSKNERIATVLHHLEKYTIDEVADLLAVSRTEAFGYIDEGNKKITSRSPEITSPELLVEELRKIIVDVNPKADLINQAFVNIYKSKSEDEVREKFVAEQKEEIDNKDENAGKGKGGFGGLLKKIIPGSKK